MTCNDETESHPLLSSVLGSFVSLGFSSVSFPFLHLAFCFLLIFLLVPVYLDLARNCRVSFCTPAFLFCSLLTLTVLKVADAGNIQQQSKPEFYSYLSNKKYSFI